MLDFKTATFEEILAYMVFQKGFSFEVYPTGYFLFQSNGGKENCTRYAQVYQNEWLTLSRRDFLAKLAVWALWREYEQHNVLTPGIKQWKDYWLLDSPTVTT